MDEPELVEEAEPTAEQLYKWTIRVLYLVAFAANFYILWDAYKDSVEVKLLSYRVKKAWRQVTRPVRESEEFRKAANWLHWEALTILKEVPTRGDTEESSG